MGTVNQEEQLKRIADALEGMYNRLDDISTSLEDIVDKLESCTAVTSHGSFLCVTGNISSY